MTCHAPDFRLPLLTTHHRGRGAFAFHKPLRGLVAIFLLAAAVPSAFSADPAPAPPQAPTATATTPAVIPVMDGEIIIDGKLDDAAWASAQTVELAYEISPGENIAPPVKTTARIGHTQDALYISFLAADTDPTQIRAHLRDRDSAFSDDFVGVMLDTFDDQRRAYEFFVNPLGVQMDLIREEASGNEDDSWDGLWTSAGAITNEGYVVEMRIPFTTLRFRSGSDVKRWAATFFRSYPRNTRHQINSSPLSRDDNCFLCSFQKYEGMADVRPGRNLEIVPTLTMGQPQSRDNAGSDWQNGDSVIEPGLDISWAPTPDMTLNATLNPDFSQVETDQIQLSFNDSFALFFPEKRPFFLEGADYFNSQFNVLYTRQIADPDFGLRVTGRTAKGAYGAIVARDATTLLLLPGVLGSGFTSLDQDANVAVGRYRHDVNQHLSIGATGTFRHGDDYGNDVVGIDARWQKDAHTVTTQFLHSSSEYPDMLGLTDRTPSGNAMRAYYGFGNRHWNVNLGHTQIDPGFRADLGFMGQVGYQKSVAGAGYTWYRDGKSINRINLYGDWDITHDHDGQLLERELEANLSFQGPKQSNFGISPLTRVRFWRGDMFNEHNLNLWGNFRILPNFQIGTYMNFGQQLDLAAARTGRRAMIGLWGNADIGRGVNLNYDISRQRLNRDGGTAFEASVADLRLGWQIDPRQRLRFTLQGSEVLRDSARYASTVNETARDIATQLVYSYKINPRTALYAGATYGAFMDDDNPTLFGNTRSMFVKISYGWQP